MLRCVMIALLCASVALAEPPKDGSPRGDKPVAKKAKAKAPPHAAPYSHVVFFKLAADAPSGAADELLADCHKLLGKIPSVRVLKAGKPAAKDSKDFVKKDYDVALVILFDDHAGLMQYIEHELHVKFVKKHIDRLDKDHLRVFDFADGK